MSNLVNRLVQQFKSKTQYQTFIRQSQEKFDINTFRFQQLTQAMARKSYNQLKQKYEQNLVNQAPRAWHENERKLFVWMILAYIKLLKASGKRLEQQHWEELSELFFDKDVIFLKYQFNAIQKNRKRHQWTQQQDQILKQCDDHIKNTNWNQIAKQIYFKTQGKSFKSAKQCRQRWQNHLDKKIKRQQWSLEEDFTILKYVIEKGKKWSKIVEELGNTRTEHMVKNRFKSLVAKADSQLREKGRMTETEKYIIDYLINEIMSKTSTVDKKSSLQNASQAKDVVQQEFFQPKLYPGKKSFNINHHGILQKGQNGQFRQTFTTRSSPVPNIFQCRSPANLSLISSSLYTHSLFTPQSCTPNTQMANNSNFLNRHNQWNKFVTKGSGCSQKSSMTSKLFQSGRNQNNIKFSQQFNNLQNGKMGSFVSTPIIQKLQSHLFNNQMDNQFLNVPSQFNIMQKSDFYNLSKEFKIQPKQQMSKSQILQINKQN